MNLPVLVAYSAAAFCAVLALVVACRARRSLPRWAFVAGMLALALESFCNGMSASAETLDGMVAWQRFRMIAASFLPGTWLLFGLSYSRGNAAEFVKRWRYVLAVALLVPPLLALGFSSGLIAAAGAVGLQDRWQYHTGPAGHALSTLLLIGAILVLVQFERTFRASVGLRRWRIKSMLTGLGILFVVRLYTSSQAILFQALDPGLQTLNAGAVLIACVLILRSLFRTQHFDNDVYPSHAVLFSSLTVVLAGVYLVLVGVAGQLLNLVGGDAAFALKAFLVLVGLVGLAVVLQSDRFRLLLRQFVSRHFQRPFYDYRSVWRKFTAGSSVEADPAARCRHVATLVAEVFEVLSVTIWLFEDNNERLALAGSTSVAAGTGEFSAPSREECHELLIFAQSVSGPVDIEARRDSWAAALRRLHPTEFSHGGGRICAPLLAHGDPVGLLVLGDRVAGRRFSAQDLDMLQSVADHAAAELLADKLATRLVQAKELEAFQSMAAFFVHDLKNAATTLNLMVKNLPVHFQDPQFRQDALRGITKTATHINDLIARLENVRGGLQVNQVDADLNQVVRRALEGWDQKPDISVTAEFGRLPRAYIDADQIHRVAANLIINAVEACSGRGSVQISTRHEGDCVVLAVSDTGCGMTADFIDRSLFRAFKTSKRGGLGIGMFQSKMIVEAHRGRITVESTPGQGTRFEVWLPVAHAAARESKPARLEEPVGRVEANE